jgi:hypothetical protein
LTGEVYRFWNLARSIWSRAVFSSVYVIVCPMPNGGCGARKTLRDSWS